MQKTGMGKDMQLQSIEACKDELVAVRRMVVNAIDLVMDIYAKVNRGENANEDYSRLYDTLKGVSASIDGMTDRLR